MLFCAFNTATFAPCSWHSLDTTLLNGIMVKLCQKAHTMLHQYHQQYHGCSKLFLWPCHNACQSLVKLALLVHAVTITMSWTCCHCCNLTQPRLPHTDTIVPTINKTYHNFTTKFCAYSKLSTNYDYNDIFTHTSVFLKILAPRSHSLLLLIFKVIVQWLWHPSKSSIDPFYQLFYICFLWLMFYAMVG